MIGSKCPLGSVKVQGLLRTYMVAVVALDVARELQDRVGAEEASDERVVDARVHVDQAELVHRLMAGEAVIRDGVELAGSGGVGAVPIIPFASAAPGVVAELLQAPLARQHAPELKSTAMSILPR
jgi:hypothetical protein